MAGTSAGIRESSVASCQICDKNPSKYVCPRCGVPYCSLVCYKDDKHLQCSESFYKECVVESLKNEEIENPESATKMKDILKRFHQQYDNDMDDNDEELEELDSDDDEPLDKRLEGVDINNADEVWKHLTEEEKREFQSLAKDVGEAGGIIPEWIPWWVVEPEKKLVTEISDSDEGVPQPENPKLHKYQPDILNPIPKMSELTRVKPNEHVARGLLNVITAYVWTARLFNGDIFDPAKIIEVSSSMIFLSSFLKKDGLFQNIEHALADVPLNACQQPILSDGGTAIQSGLNRDVWLIVKGPESQKTSSSKQYLLSALTECYELFRRASRALKESEKSDPKLHKENSANSFSKLFPATLPDFKVDIKVVNKAKRKTLYLLAFANEFVENMNINDL